MIIDVFYLNAFLLRILMKYKKNLESDLATLLKTGKRFC